MRLAVVAIGFVVAARRLRPWLAQRAFAFFMGLPASRISRVRHFVDVRIPGATPGVQLASSLFVREEGGLCPTLIVRTPYNIYWLDLMCYGFAGQGFNVLVQDCRGRFASTGQQTFAAFEDQDGVATLDWLATQGFSWYDPSRVVMFGISYLGIVQWALVAGLERRRCKRLATIASCNVAGADAGTDAAGANAASGVVCNSCVARDGAREEHGHETRLAAIAPLFASSRAHDAFFRNNAFALDFYVRYLQLMTTMTTNRSQAVLGPACLLFELKFQRHVCRCLGIGTLQKRLQVPRLFKYNPRPDSKFWKNRDYSDALACAPPALIASGWHDLFLEGSVRDFQAVVQAHGPGHATLLIGPWTHLDSLRPDVFVTLARSSVEFLQRRTGLRDPDEDEGPVRLWVMGPRCGTGHWRNFSDFPPKEAEEELLFLGPGSLLPWNVADQSSDAPSLQRSISPQRVDRSDSSECRLLGPRCSRTASRSGSSRLDYNPRDPTPTIGGSIFAPWLAGEKEQSVLLKRNDVLTFDTTPLEEDVTIVGRARLRLTLKVSRPCFDIFARICDVHPSGRTYNVCDAVLRYRGPLQRHHSSFNIRETSPTTTPVDMFFAPTAKLFKAAHRIRLLVAGGSFPQFMRHFGDAEQALEEEPLEVQPYTLEVVHGELDGCTALALPVLDCSLSGSLDSPQSVRRRRSLAWAATELGSSPKHVVASFEDADAGIRRARSYDVVQK